MTIQIAREKNRCCHCMGYSFRLAASVVLYTPSQRHDIRPTYHGLCYTNSGVLAGSIGPSRRIDPTSHRTMSRRSSSIVLLQKNLKLTYRRCELIWFRGTAESRIRSAIPDPTPMAFLMTQWTRVRSFHMRNLLFVRPKLKRVPMAALVLQILDQIGYVWTDLVDLYRFSRPLQI